MSVRKKKRIQIGRFLRRSWPIILALCIFTYNSIELNFIQDDAYISFRYVANYLNGDGLVYNIGERVEGITNMGWVILMILWGSIGLDYIFWSQMLGFFLGAGVIVVSFLLARRLFDDSVWLTASTVLLVGINPSLAYWSPAGLETAAFAFLAVVSLYYYITRNWLIIASFTLAVWIRPEGAVVVGILVLIEAIVHRRLPVFTLSSAGIAFILSLPFVVFKLVYYGSIPPNPFYAKTSLTMLQMMDGVEYTGRFLMHYGFYGLGYIIPLLFWRKLSIEGKSLWLFVAGYTLYIVLIGGDVLKVHRFFLPLFGPAAVLITLSIVLILKQLRLKARGLVLILAIVPLLVLTYLLPRYFVKTYNRIEKNFTNKMGFFARELKKSDQSNFTVALPTIGIFGYELIGHNVIDMLGLTDSTIARYSEKPIPGMQSTWKEQKHNSRYLLEREPDYIIFSTGIKPSAPAEKALLLYPQFLRSYRSVGWFYEYPGISGQGKLVTAFKKVRPVVGDIAPTYPVEYVEYYKLGLDAFSHGDKKTALRNYNLALKASPKPYNLDLLYAKAFVHIDLGDEDIIRPILNLILKQDSLVFEAHKDLYSYSVLTGDIERAELHKRWLLDLVPWYFPRLDSLTQQKLKLIKPPDAKQSS